jgi:hypothetical protein
MKIEGFILLAENLDDMREEKRMESFRARDTFYGNGARSVGEI